MDAEVTDIESRLETKVRWRLVFELQTCGVKLTFPYTQKTIAERAAYPFKRSHYKLEKYRKFPEGAQLEKMLPFIDIKPEKILELIQFYERQHDEKTKPKPSAETISTDPKDYRPGNRPS